MSLPILTAVWQAITGHPKVNMILVDGKPYIPLSAAVSATRAFRLKLIRMGLLKMPGIESVGVLELFDILAKQIQLLEQGQSTDTQKLVTDANGRVVNQSIPAPPLPVFGDMYTDAYGQRISDR